ncbi:helix-turn-helix domain-containing protein [Ferrimonas aestuarii]|uniref:Helix-turn-helix transcriptional regulator n=1 Tax=Ferrimonas aestuarii TaxID=2569539 RepID=A0A4U1BPI9_9GAMM|nr:AraC family transcriptional regulator [Ferrimonas aestuarii]TKB55462.1 helix-turn-helix transcriptional regulator [Ferrimonas aestuarii]
MAPVSSTQLMSNPVTFSEVMPNVASSFIDIGQGITASIYQGMGTNRVQAAMTNDSDLINFSCLLNGQVEFRSGRFCIKPSTGNSSISFLPHDRFDISASSQFRQVELMLPKEVLQELAGSDADWLLEDIAKGHFYRDCAPGQQGLNAAMTLFKRLSSRSSSPLMIKAAVYEFLAWQLDNPGICHQQHSVPLRERKQLMEARELLLQDLCCAPTIAELARETGLNQLKLKRGFKLLFGSSIYNLFLQERMNHAKQLLSKHNVGETAQMLGYSNASHFSKAFQKQYGVCPSEARKHAI